MVNYRSFRRRQLLIDRISNLPDELLLKILSLLPTKNVVATTVLSKRWKPLWKLVPELEFDDTNIHSEYKYRRFSRFVQRSLSLHEAQVVESVSFKLGPLCGALDMDTWVRLAVSRCLRKLEIDLSYSQRLIRVPQSIYTCKTLDSLLLCGAVLVYSPDRVYLPSLTFLFLFGVTYSSDESVHRLLYGCHNLECLGIRRIRGDNVKVFTVKVPSLVALYISGNSEEWPYIGHGLVIDAPSLLLLIIAGYNGGFCLLGNAPRLDRANVDAVYNNCDTFMASLASVRHLKLCLSVPLPPYPKGTIFNRLRELELCTCIEGWLNLLMSLLQDSPNLQVLKLKLSRNHEWKVSRPAWNQPWNQPNNQPWNQPYNQPWKQPSTVPECVSLKLKMFEWSGYKGSQEERELASYILRNGKSLKTVIITSKYTNLRQRYWMMKQLTLSARGSPTCELVFN